MIDVAGMDCRVVSHDWAFARDNAAAIDAHWNRLRKSKPDLFNGRVFLTCDWTIEAAGDTRILRSSHFETEFKAFIAWRDFGFPDTGVLNGFAAGAIRGSDGGFVLGEMGAHTANAGKIYFPCGTPDPEDECAGRLDMQGSVLRELKEETGLCPPLVIPSHRWSIVHDGPMLACLQTVTSAKTAIVLAGRAEKFLAACKDPELARMHCMHTLADFIPGRMPDYITIFLEREFAGKSG